MSAPAHSFLFADIAGYSAFTEAHGDERAADMVADFCRTVRALLHAPHATEVKTIGDAVMVHVDDAARAVELGRRIVDELGYRHGFPTVRVGVHSGAAVERRGDWFGAAVNVASRIGDAAGEHEVLVSAATRDAAAERLPDLDFVPAGSLRPRNVTDPVELFRVEPAGSAAVARLPRDPVCRMLVDPERAARTMTHRGREYLFCSDRCHDAFAANPETYAAPHRSRSRLLVSARARERVVRRLGRAYRSQRLDAAELQARMERAYAARTRRQLLETADDLPRPRRTRRRWRPPWRRP